jgi:hypothetical protein
VSQVKLIGLHGPKQSGKDATYRAIKEIKDDTTTGVVRDAFADRLKLSAARCFKPDATLEEALEWANRIKQDEFTIEVWYGGTDDYEVVTGREFLQHYGTEAHREVFADDFWIEAVIPNPNALAFGREDLVDGDILVITDVRFPNEAEAIRDAGGEVWKIYRPEAENTGDTHASEVPLPDELIDRVIDNSGDLVNLLYDGRAPYDDRELVDSVPKGHGVSVSGGNW